MILFFYNLALLAGLVVGAPWWLYRLASANKYRDGLLERLGRVRLSDSGKRRPLIWIHAVSVGEVLAVSRLVKELDAALPDSSVAVSTTTFTGQQLARERFGADRVFYCPLDFPWAVRAYLKALQPRMLVLAETELWPNLLSGCFRRGIPVAIVNARISDRSWPRYRLLRWLWRPFLRRLSRVLAQSQIDAERFEALGCSPEQVVVAGNLKFDVRAADRTEATRLLKALKLDMRLVVAGSTLEEEEAALLQAWPQLVQFDPRMILVVAPRHPERFEAVASLLEQSGLAWKKRSDWRDQPAGSIKLLQPGQIVLLDSIGELASVYSLASVAFVGGSLIPAGGHNPLEPAQFGIPVVLGPHYANFRAITDELRAHQAVRIAERQELAGALIEFLRDRPAAEAMGQRAMLVFEQQAGATKHCVDALQELLAASQAREKLGLAELERAAAERFEQERAALAKAELAEKIKLPATRTRGLLLPLVPAYRLALWLRERRLGTRLEPVRRLRFPVVSIGNLSTGGTGKTPLTIALARALNQGGLHVDVLSRGYGRTGQFAVRVPAKGAAEEFGDEPLLIARQAEVPVYVANQRYDAGLLAEGDAAAIAFLGEDRKPIVHLLDDGFQHRQLYRDADILLIDRQDWTDRLLPAGNLREPLAAARRASIIAIPADDAGLEATLRVWGWQGPVWRLKRTMEIPTVEGPVAAFCGIARPHQFFAGLAAAGKQLAVQTVFADHQPYTQADIERLLAAAYAAGSVAALTTEKDFVRMGRLSSLFPDSLPLKTVGLRVEIEQEGKSIEWLVDEFMPHM